MAFDRLKRLIRRKSAEELAGEKIAKGYLEAVEMERARTKERYRELKPELTTELARGLAKRQLKEEVGGFGQEKKYYGKLVPFGQRGSIRRVFSSTYKIEDLTTTLVIPAIGIILSFTILSWIPLLWLAFVFMAAYNILPSESKILAVARRRADEASAVYEAKKQEEIKKKAEEREELEMEKLRREARYAPRDYG